jgi:hypothetical protein
MFFSVNSTQFIVMNWEDIKNPHNDRLKKIKCCFELVIVLLYCTAQIGIKFALKLFTWILPKTNNEASASIRIHRLIVQEKAKEEWNNLYDTILLWRINAQMKCKDTEKLESESHNTFKTSVRILKRAEKRLYQFPINKLFSLFNYVNPERVLVCNGPLPLETTQAIAIIQNAYIFYKCGIRKFIKINILATNPNNINSPINDSGSSKIKGAGTALIYRISKFCMEEKLAEGILLKSTENAEIFYQTLGFHRFNILCDEHWILTKKRMNELYKTWKEKLRSYSCY